MGMVKTLDVRASVANYSQLKQVSLYACHSCCVVDCSRKIALITTVVPLWLVESVDRYNFCHGRGVHPNPLEPPLPVGLILDIYICGIYKYDILYIH